MSWVHMNICYCSIIIMCAIPAPFTQSINVFVTEVWI